MNPASRIAEILKTAQAQKPNITVGAAWAKTFKIPNSEDEFKRNMEVLTFFSLLNDEFILIEEQMKQDNSLEDRLIRPALSVVKAVLGSVGRLDSQWQPFRDQIQDNTLKDLGWISREFEKAENKEEEISRDELDNLIKEISELEELIEKSNLSPPVRQVILHHIEIIRRAIRHYPIIGALAFKNAVVEGYGEAKLAKEFLSNDLNKEENFNVLRKFSAVWERTQTNMGKISKLYGYGRMSYDLGSKGKGLIEWLTS